MEAGQAPDPASEHSEGSKYRQIFRLREVHLLAFFILVYVGVEVTIGGMCQPFLYTQYLLSTDSRLDCHLHRFRQRWWIIFGICILRFLRWYVAFDDLFPIVYSTFRQA